MFFCSIVCVSSDCQCEPMHIFTVHCIKRIAETLWVLVQQQAVGILLLYKMHWIHSLTLKLGVVRGLVGDGVEDLVDLWAEIPFTVQREGKTGQESVGL